MSTTAGLRKRRTHRFVQIPSATIRDKSLSFRSRGILALLLDLPDGWDVKSEVLASMGTEGREAVRTALKELAGGGYYRLERRQLLDGTFQMGTAISEEPVPDWARDSAEYDNRAVPCVQQIDGSFKVRHKDGSLTADGFEDVAVDASPEDPDDDPPGGAQPTEDGFSGSGFPGSGAPGPGSPDSGSPGALSKKETEDREGTTSASLRSPADGGSDDASSTAAPPLAPVLTENELATGRDANGKPLTGKRLDALAQSVTKAWWDWIEPQGHSKPTNSFLACRGVVRSALGNGVPPKPIKHALAQLTVEGRVVSANTLGIAIAALRNPGAGPGGRPARAVYDERATWGERPTTAEGLQGMSEAEAADLFGSDDQPRTSHG